MIYLGKIIVPAGEGQNNFHTAVPFEIAHSVSKIFLAPDTAGVLFETPLGDNQTTEATGAPIGPANTLLGVLIGGAEPSIAIWNPTAGEATVKVFRELGI